MVGHHVEFPCHKVRFGFLHSERLGTLETFDLNENDLNGGDELQKMTEFDDFNLLNDLNEE